MNMSVALFPAVAGTNEDYENPLLLQFSFEDKKTKDMLCCICEGTLPGGRWKKLELRL